jgi:hypothetical protein
MRVDMHTFPFGGDFDYHLMLIMRTIICKSILSLVAVWPKLVDRP